jgi:exopolyphosphatase/guanosine-5'-triphosphate,3'-diphosphate pyrophosphatase
MTEVDPATGSQDPSDPAPTLAAVDLGSNSFHLIVADVSSGSIRIVDRLREVVRLASGLKKGGRLSIPVRERALDTLERIGERVRDLPRGSVRAVGTHTFRRASRSGGFLEAARERLGHPIDVISGQEEARLIWLGVAHDVQPITGQRLVVDIGGGSTEVILGRAEGIRRAYSLRMGCVNFTGRFFQKGCVTSKSWRKARTAAAIELEPVKRKIRKSGWDHALGASGTVRAVARYGQALGVSKTGITKETLEAVADSLLAAGTVDTWPTSHVSEDRRAVFAGGVAILQTLFQDLRIDRLQVADGALREGALVDLLGRVRHEDVRDKTVVTFMKRFHVDSAQASRVEATALGLLEQVFADWGIKGGEATSWLRWASRLHEVGMSVSHSGYHKHGAYLLTHAEMPGFSRGDQALLAALVGGHRRRIPLRLFAELPARHQRKALRLAILLRLAATLHRSRASAALPPFTVRGSDDSLTLHFPKGWRASHPLTRTDLENEVDYLDRAGISLSID